MDAIHRREMKAARIEIQKIVFHAWARAHVPNGMDWRDCNPPQRVIDAYNAVYGA